MKTILLLVVALVACGNPTTPTFTEYDLAALTADMVMTPDIATAPDLAIQPDLTQVMTGCLKDLDCKGFRICSGGQCVEPPDMFMGDSATVSQDMAEAKQDMLTEDLVKPDMTSSPDITVQPDMVKPADLVALPDLAPTPTCTDKVMNGWETDVDCGAGCPTCGGCLRCEVGKHCKQNSNCVEGVCTGGICQAPTCSDGVKNGGESDIDCGRACSRPVQGDDYGGLCGSGKICGLKDDCFSKGCGGDPFSKTCF